MNYISLGCTIGFFVVIGLIALIVLKKDKNDRDN